MSRAWNAYLAPHPYEFSLLRTSPREYVVRLEQTEPVPLELPALFGEWLYNLRSALDHLIWAAAAHASGRVPPPDEHGLQYPIYDDEKAWQKNLWRLKHMAPHQIEMLRRMQPFHSDPDANYLGWINRLARIDRHRRLTQWTTRVAEAEPVFKIPSGVAPSLDWGQRVFEAMQCDLARLRFPTAKDAERVEFNPRVGLDPEIAEWGASAFWRQIRFSERIRMITVFVAGEIDSFDFDCTGSPAARRTATEAFAAESDLRRRNGVFPSLVFPRPASPQWMPADAPVPSTDARFRGEGFHPDGKGRPIS